MKKYIKYIFTLAGFLTVFTSCDDFLNRAPGVNLDEEKVFSKFENAQAFHADIYASIEQRFNAVGNHQPVPMATASDEAEAPRGYHGSRTFYVGSYDGVDANMYSYYSGIRKANLFLLKSNIIPFPNDNVKNKMLGEVYFLRAYYYFELIKRFGGVPLMKDVPEDQFKPGDNLMRPRNSYKECVTFILSDLQQAIAMLPVELTDPELGRATKGAAMALRSRLLLYAASPLWKNEMGNLWAEAAQAAKEVIDLKDNGVSVYELYNSGRGADDYEALFFKRREHGNKEVIFHKHEGPVGFKNPQIEVWAPAGDGFGGNGAVCPTQNFVNLFETKNGLKREDDTQYDASKPFDNLDPRFYKIILYDGGKWQNITVETFIGGKHRKDRTTDYTPTGYYVRKYLPEGVKDKSTNTEYHNWIIFRLAEMYLNYAEALNETLSEPDDNVYNAINKVRTRSGMPNLPVGLSKEQMRERIQNERAIELSFEEHRWWDARRWKKGTEWFNGTMYEMEITEQGGVKNYEVKAYNSRIYYSYMDLYPLPNSEIQKNPLLRQNDGWN